MKYLVAFALLIGLAYMPAPDVIASVFDSLATPVDAITTGSVN